MSGEIKMGPEISIIIPLYNAEFSIGECIRSIQAQTFTDWKLFVVNDGSTDRSPIICEELAKNDKRITVLHKKNGGVSSARNYALDKIETPYFVFIDSDDSVEPEYLEVLLDTKKRFPDAGSIWCCFQTVDSQAKDNLKVFLADENEQYSFFSRSEIMSLYQLWMLQMLWHKLFDTKLVNSKRLRMDENISLGEDLLFNLQYLDNCELDSIVVVNRPLYNYVRGNSDSLDHKFVSEMLLYCKKTDDYTKQCMNKWNSSEGEWSLFYNAEFYKYERVLGNTFHPDNKASFFKKIKFNNQVLRSEEFGEVLNKRSCIVHPLLLKAYKSKRYEFVLVFNFMVKIKYKLFKR